MKLKPMIQNAETTLMDRSSRVIRFCYGALSLGFLTACATGPAYQSPLQDLANEDAAFIGIEENMATTNSTPAGDWWQLYQDPLLNQYVGEALQANTDLRESTANLKRAQALLKETRRGRLPETEISAARTKSRSNFFLDEPIAVENTVYTAELGLSYQLDFFGRVSNSIKAAGADAQAAEAIQKTVAITVAAETARAYADVCAAGYLLDVTGQSVDLQQRSVDLTREQVDAGRGTAFDVASASAALAQTRARLPSLESNRDAALYRLAVLMGRAPADYPQAAADCQQVPGLDEALPVGDGRELLLRRPDIARAERELAAATARVGIAAAALYPSVSFGASVGSSALSAAALGDSETQTWSFGPLLSWSFPNFTVAKTRKAQAEADVEAARARFDGTWLNALQETETVLSAYSGGLERLSALEDARDFSADAAMLADARFEAGVISFLDVLQTQLTLVQTEDALAQARAAVVSTQIALFLALGGSWD